MRGEKTSYSASFLENLNRIYRKKRQTPCRGNWTRFAQLQSHNCVELIEGKIFLSDKCNSIGIAVKEPRTEQKIQLMKYSEIREADTSPLSEIWDIYRINRHQHIMVFSFGILKRAI